MQTLFLFVDLQWIVLYCLGKSITNNNNYNEYNYNPTAIKFQCIFARIIFYSVDIIKIVCCINNSYPTLPCELLYMWIKQSKNDPRYTIPRADLQFLHAWRGPHIIFNLYRIRKYFLFQRSKKYQKYIYALIALILLLFLVYFINTVLHSNKK